MNTNLKRILVLVGAIVAVVCVYLIVSTIQTVRTTGVLKVDSTDKYAVFAISKANGEAKIIGTGKTSVRLKPGTYVVSATGNNRLNFTSVQVSNGQVAHTSLNLTTSVVLPSTQSVSYSNTDAFIARGLTVAQISDLKLELFKFKPSEQNVFVNYNSVQNGPRNPNVDTTFNITFNLTIDSVGYKGIVKYYDLTTVHLYLYNPSTSALIYDSGN